MSFKSAHSRVIERLLGEELDRITESVMAGVLDYPMYRELVGRVRGLDLAIQLSQQADVELSGEPNARG